LPFDAEALPDRGELRDRLGLGEGPLVVCSAGGTAFGTPLLEMCGAALDLLREKRPELRMILVCGPRLSPGGLARPGLEVRGYIEKLYELFAACDLAVVQAGGTTTLELTALRTPFLYFPLREHFEQEVCVSARLARHGAGVRMDFSETTPRSLAEAVEAHLGEAVHSPPIPVHGAQRAAEILTDMLEAKGQEGE
jgi:predicted glycosyltransferase